ncbi:hypothetical protein BS78_08G142000 [Paspalum vaginatum]|nr:hypothetical protein BS78_08G142000 [Paspalum vaginatum]
MGELIRKKRGRPRKYTADGSMALAPISSASAGGPDQLQHGSRFSISSPASNPNAKHRGRPLGPSKKKQFEALGARCCARVFSRAGSWGIAFTPHILTVKAGEVKIHRSCSPSKHVVVDGVDL